MKKVLGLGNALVDVLIRIDNDALLTKLNLPKGSMQLIDSSAVDKILEAGKVFPMEVASGGSAANTINGLAELGMATGYIGKIGSDDYGKLFQKDMESRKVDTKLLHGNEATGRSIILISPDSERTLATFLGAAIELTPNDIRPDQFNGFDFFHLEGYLVQNQALIEKAAKTAKERNLTISIDLASFNVVADNLDFLHHLVRHYVDVVFANEEEARVFTNSTPEQAAVSISQLCDIAVVKIGEKGSIICQGDQMVHVNAATAKSIDTTGAGDLYASGFIYGLLQGQSLERCGELGSLVAANVIEVVGAKIPADRWMAIRAKL